MRFMDTFTGWRAGVAIRMHYFRGGGRMSSRRECIGLPVVPSRMVSARAVAGVAGLFRGGVWSAAMRGPKAAKAAPRKKVEVDDVEDDKPVLHRKKHDGAKPAGGSTAGSGSASSHSASAPDDDPDRPKLHKKTSDDSGAGTASSTNAGGAPVSDPDQPKLEKKPAGDSSGTASSSSSTSPDSDRPT